MPLDAQIMDRLFNSPQLPSLPAIALQIIELVQQDEVDVDKIAETISLDPALSTKMLKTVNSSFYGLPKTIGSVHQAVVVLGLNSVKTLALGFSLVSNLTGAGGEGFDHMTFWRRSLYSATAAKQLCEKLNIVQAEEVFMASLLQDVGVLALAQVLGRPYSQLIQKAGNDHRKLGLLELETYGGDHCEVGAALAESWGLPPLLVEAIRLHENADESPENLRQLIRTVQAGSYAAEVIEKPDDQERVGCFYKALASWFDLEQDASEALLREVFKHAAETQRLFELPTGDLADADAILSQAKEALSHIEAETPTPTPTSATLPATATPTSSGVIETEAITGDDELTGLLGRRAFDERLDELFIISGSDQPLSLVFVDIDELKLVNEAHGEPAGDSVLRSLADTLNRHIDCRAELFRFKEDEFTLLCPGMTRSDAALLAEELRATIEQAGFEIGGGPDVKTAKITASIGVATYEGVLFKRPEQLVKAATNGVFAAKGGGRNVVRVFVPKGESQPKAA